MRKFLPGLCLAVFALTACGESEPSVDEQRQAACESFAALSPGVLEMQDDFEVMSDPDASSAEKSAALKRQAAAEAEPRDYPYDCDRPSDKELFEKHYGTFDEE